MDRRTKILASAFGVLVAYAAMTGVVYPRWIEPLVTIDDRIAERQQELDRLEAQVEKVNKARYEYREWAGRAGGFDINTAVTEIRSRLNKLLEKHKLTNVKVTPTRPSQERKTGLWTATVTIAGSGAFDSVVRFLEDISELPQLCRVGNVSISPSSARSRKATINRVNLRVPVEIWAVPQNRIVGRLNPKDLVHPDFFVRHDRTDYAPIWKGDPFNEYVVMKVKTHPTMTVVQGKRAPLDVSVEGGVGPYTYKWTPEKGLTTPDKKNPVVDTSVVGRQVYTVTVGDARGHTGKSLISVTVAEPPRKAPPITPTQKSPPPVVATGRKTSKDARYQRLTMVLLRESKDDKRDEIMVHHSRSKQNSYYGIGDPFEGGELIFIHQSGALVKWEDKLFVYPLGETLDHFIPAEKALEYPILQRAAGKYMELMKQLAQVDDPKTDAATDDAKSSVVLPVEKPHGPKPVGKGSNTTGLGDKKVAHPVRKAPKKPAAATVPRAKRNPLPVRGKGTVVVPGKRSPLPVGKKKPIPVKTKNRRQDGKRN